MNTAVIWGKIDCPNCDKAKLLLEKNNFDVVEKKLNVDFTLEEIRALIPNVRAVPQVFINDELIGDYTSLVKYLSE